GNVGGGGRPPGGGSRKFRGFGAGVTPGARRNARVRLDRGKREIKSNLAERRAPRRDHCLGAFQPPLADVAMRRRAHGGGKRASKMKDAETSDIGEAGDRDVVRLLHVGYCVNWPTPS